MPVAYQEFNKEEFEEELASYGFKFELVEDTAKELVYKLQLTHDLALKIFSSIDERTFKTRKSGSDAIRVIPVFQSSTKGDMLLSKAKRRTNRTKNWSKNLLTNIQLTIKEGIGDKYKRGTCGHILTLRNGRFGEFWGCLNYPDCRCTHIKGYVRNGS